MVIINVVVEKESYKTSVKPEPNSNMYHFKGIFVPTLDLLIIDFRYDRCEHDIYPKLSKVIIKRQ